MNPSSLPKIPILDLAPEIDELWGDLQEAMQRVLRSGHFIMGPEVEAFEREIAAFLGVEHAVAVNSGTDALFITLRALGVSPGDEVITTPFTFVASAEAISLIGAVPIFADIDPSTLNLDSDQVAAKISPRTKAIIPVHLFGQSCEMDPLLALAQRNQLVVLEDVAQAMGGRYRGRMLGTIGAGGAFSFFPSKNLGAFGDGGLITTDDARVAEISAMLRAHGSKRRYFNELLGYNSRLDALQAAMLRVKLPHLDRANAGRRAAAARYDALLSRGAFAPGEAGSGVVTPRPPAHIDHVYHQYTIRIPNGLRDSVHEKVAADGIATMIYYPVPAHRLPVYAHLEVSCPLAEAAAREVLSLPIWPQITADTQERVVESLRSALLGG